MDRQVCQLLVYRRVSCIVRKRLVDKDGLEFIIEFGAANMRRLATVWPTQKIEHLRMAAARPANDWVVFFPRLILKISYAVESVDQQTQEARMLSSYKQR